MVIVQSFLFDRSLRRMVVPLVRRSALPDNATTAGSRKKPVFEVGGVPLVLYLLDMVSVAANQLGEHVTYSSEHGQAVADVLDVLLTLEWDCGPLRPKAVICESKLETP